MQILIYKMNERGISPVIATVLLVSMAVVLALIVLFWARGFISEEIQKRGEPIQNSCEEIDFVAEISDFNLKVINKGNVAIYGIEVKKKDFGSISNLDNQDKQIPPGETSEEISITGLSSGDNVIVVPKILGEKDDKKISFTCDIEFGYPIKV